MTSSSKLKTQKSNALTIAGISSRTPSLGTMISSRNKRYSDILEPAVIYDGGVRYTKNTLSQEQILGEIHLGVNDVVEKNKGNILTIKGIPVRITKLNEQQYRASSMLYKISKDMRFVNKENAKDPTWAQLKSFLSSNIIFKNILTGKAQYKSGKFMCQDFSISLLNTAYASGIRCGDVSIIYKDGRSHTVNVFDTTDHGWVFVDSSIGLVLSKKNFFSQGNVYTPDFAAIRSKEKRPSFVSYLRDKYFAEGVDAVQIMW